MGFVIKFVDPCGHGWQSSSEMSTDTGFVGSGVPSQGVGCFHMFCSSIERGGRREGKNREGVILSGMVCIS